MSLHDLADAAPDIKHAVADYGHAMI